MSKTNLIVLLFSVIYWVNAQNRVVFPGATNDAHLNDLDEAAGGNSIKLWNDNRNAQRTASKSTRINEWQSNTNSYDNERVTEPSWKNTNSRSGAREETTSYRNAARRDSIINNDRSRDSNRRNLESNYDRERAGSRIKSDSVSSLGVQDRRTNDEWDSSTSRKNERERETSSRRSESSYDDDRRRGSTSRRNYDDDDDDNERYSSRKNTGSSYDDERRTDSSSRKADKRYDDRDRNTPRRTTGSSRDDSDYNEDRRSSTRRTSIRNNHDSRERGNSQRHDDNDWRSSNADNRHEDRIRNSSRKNRNRSDDYDDDADDNYWRRESKTKTSNSYDNDSNQRNFNRKNDRDSYGATSRRNSNSRESSDSGRHGNNERSNTYDNDGERERNRENSNSRKTYDDEIDYDHERETRKVNANTRNTIYDAQDSTERRQQDSENVNTNRFNKNTNSRPRRLCERKYTEYMVRIFPNEANTEADSNDDDFDGRKLAAPGEYPHMTAVGFATVIQRTDYKCGGSLISEHFVITAAHCTNMSGEAPIKVRIGDLNLKIEERFLEPQVYSIVRIFRHPGYKSDIYYNDIALLQLNQTVEFTEFVRPIRLWVNPEIKYSVAYAMGYGATAFGKERTHRLTDLNLTLVPNDVCNEQLPKSEEAPRGIIESQICAQDYEKNRDTCQGDSGGPLQLNLFGRRQTNRKHYHLIGITSYGVFCRSHHPSVYTRISSYLDWIESVVWSNQS